MAAGHSGGFFVSPAAVLGWVLPRLRPPMAPTAAVPRFYVGNRRDGSRLLSSALVITGAGLIRSDHPLGQAVALVAGLLSLYCWLCYRKLQN